MTLDLAPRGLPVVTTGSRGTSPAVSRRLAELGIRPGVALRVLSRTSGGGAILALGDDRLAVSRHILAGIEVTESAPARG